MAPPRPFARPPTKLRNLKLTLEPTMKNRWSPEFGSGAIVTALPVLLSRPNISNGSDPSGISISLVSRIVSCPSGSSNVMRRSPSTPVSVAFVLNASTASRSVTRGLPIASGPRSVPSSVTLTTPSFGPASATPAL